MADFAEHLVESHNVNPPTFTLPIRTAPLNNHPTPPLKNIDAIPTRSVDSADADASEDEAEDLTLDYPIFAAPTQTHALLPDPISETLPHDDHAAPPAPPPQPTSTGALPRRGLKDFEPHPTSLQATTLATSRAAMHAALSHTRTHAARSRVLGVYDERVGTVRVQRRRGAMFASVGRDLGKEDGRGWSGGVELNAEEALWGLESGRCDVRYRRGCWAQDGVKKGFDVDLGPADGLEGDDGRESSEKPTDEQDASEENEERLLPMSLQGAYAAFIGHEDQRTSGHGLTMEKYVVYASLKRAGFIVTRAKGFDGRKTVRRSDVTAHHIQDTRNRSRSSANSQNLGLFAKLYQLLLQPFRPSSQQHQRNEQARLACGPLVKPGLYRSYADIYRLLAIIPAPAPSYTITSSPYGRSDTGDPENTSDESTEDVDIVSTPYTTTYNIYNPNTHYRKSAPPIPHYRICVISARDTRLPTLPELHGLLAEQAVLGSPTPASTTSRAQTQTTATTQKERKERSLGATYASLKKGACSVLLAVVDEGIVSYLRVSEAGFVVEGDLAQKDDFAGGSKRGGKGGGKGRGRGRGGRGGGGGRGRGG